MKITRILSSLLVMLTLLVVLVGCGTDDPYATPTDRKAFATDASSFNKNIKSVIDEGKYDIADNSNGESGSVTYKKTSDESNNSFDFKINMGDGSSFSLPTDLAKMNKKGWSENVENNFRISSSATVYDYVEFNNARNEKIFMCAANKYTGYTKLPLGECDIFLVRFELNSGKQCDGAPSFELGNGIDAYSDIKDLVKTLGQPDSIIYYESNDNAYLKFGKKNENGTVSEINVSYDVQGNYINSLEVLYNPSQIESKGEYSNG